MNLASGVAAPAAGLPTRAKAQKQDRGVSWVCRKGWLKGHAGLEVAVFGFI